MSPRPSLARRLGILAIVALSLAVIALATLLGINDYVVTEGRARICSPEQAAELGEIDCILVLGCGVREDGTPSDMLRDRLTRGLSLYHGGASEVLLMSGDHHTVAYNEVQVMKNYAISDGIPSEQVFMDHAGLNTYDSLWRAKEVFGADRILIVSQEYHLYRALHIAEQLGIEAWGVSADYHTYFGQVVRDVREVLARSKDFLLALFRPEATIGGEPISLEGSGDVTNDEWSISS